MKRFAIVALLAATLFGATSASAATELKVKGNLDVYGMWSANLGDFNSDLGDTDNYSTTQRMRTYFTFQANENLKAVLGLEMDTTWGDSAGDWGTDGKGNIEVKHAYLDFTFPDTAVNVKAGLQTVALPSVFGNPVFDDDAAALVVSAPINDMFALTAGYTRGVDGSTNFDDAIGTDSDGNDNVDMAFLAAAITLDGFDATPYVAYARAGASSDDTAGSWDLSTNPPVWTAANAGTTEATNVWVLGVNANLTMFDPFTLSADLIYGAANSDDENNETKGWYAALAGSYKFDMLTATLFGTYGSGLNEDGDTKMPTLAEGWGVTPYIGGVRAFNTGYDSFASGALADFDGTGMYNDGTGLWTLGLSLTDITFVDNLSHSLTIAYGQGTSTDDSAAVLCKGDSVFEVYMVNKYMIYENLAAINELGYFKASIDKADDMNYDLDASYFATIGLSYTF